MYLTKTIYADELFIINFIINYLLLFAAARIGGEYIKRRRLVLSACIGAVYGLLIFFRELSFLGSVAGKLIFAAVMTAAAFGIRERRRFLKNLLLFLASSLSFGGIILFLYIFGFNSICEIRNNIYYIDVPAHTLILSSIFAYAVLSFVFRKRAEDKKANIKKIDVIQGEKSVSFFALTDTGNSLCDPRNNAPVIIAEYSSVRELLSPCVTNVLDAKNPECYPLALPEICDFGTFRLLPFSTVDSSFSLLLAFRPEAVSADGVVLSDALIAISRGKICGGAYTAII